MQLIEGFLAISSMTTILLIFIGVIFGITFGAIPGLSAFTCLALMLPITFGMEPINGLSFLLAVYVGGVSGGLISAILLNIPGTPSSIATCFDGAPMAARGEAGKALGVGIVFSFIGGLFSAIILTYFGPPIAKFALRFSPYEYFAVILFALTTVSSLASGNMINGLISCLLGISLSFVGIDRLSSYTRYTMGYSQLDSGFSIVPLLIGVFAVAQILDIAEGEKKHLDLSQRKTVKIKGFGFSLKEFFGQLQNALYSGLIGLGVGILPGIGGNISNLMSYAFIKKRSKYPEKFGTGIIDGIVASETSNNAAVGGALIILLTLGIPGDNATAMILAGFMVHGISPGPLLFETSAALVYALFAAFILANIVMLVCEIAGLNLFVKLLSIPKAILLPVVIVFCFIGSFSGNNNLFDITLMVAFGFLGYLMKKFKFPLSPLVVGFILAPLLEENLRRSLMRSEGSLMPILTSPIAAVFLAGTAFMIWRAIVSERKQAQKGEK
ncbi:MAG: tripartite tricarboxylate transporter permease [Phycisphaerales bacterium]|nr:tripartite tricarboxylate transporter permease [Phycisphaerales bacterium]